MSAQYGITTQIGSLAARPILIETSTRIGIAGISSALRGVHPYASASQAKAALSEDDNLQAPLQALLDQGVNPPVVLSAIAPNTTPSTEKTNLAAAIALLKNPPDGARADLLIAAKHSHEQAIAIALIQAAESLKGIAIADIQATNESATLAYRNQFDSNRLIVCAPKIQPGEKPLSHLIAALIAKTDASEEYGFAESFSNRTLQGTTGLSRPIEFLPGLDCEADRLRRNSITSVIAYQSYRTWGADTATQDPIWRDLARVRTFDRIVAAAMKGVFWAIDRNASDTLKAVKDSVEQMLLGLQGARKLLGFEVLWDTEQNTRDNITAGRFYLLANLQNTPHVKRLQITFNYTNVYGGVLFEEVS